MSCLQFEYQGVVNKLDAESKLDCVSLHSSLNHCQSNKHGTSLLHNSIFFVRFISLEAKPTKLTLPNGSTQKFNEQEINPKYLVADPLMDGSAADVAGLLAGADGIHGDPIRLQRLERDHDLVVLHVVAAEQEHLLRRHL